MSNIKNNSCISFGSLKNPIKTFSIKTKVGKLKVSEVRIKSSFSNDAKKLGSLFIENFIDGSIDPAWKELKLYGNDMHLLISKQKYTKFIADTFQKDDGHTTMLVAKDATGNVAGALFSTTFNGFPTLGTKRVLSVEGLVVDSKYRNCDVAKKMLQRLFESSKKDFDDVILTAYKKAIPFYEKIGFQSIEPDSIKKRLFLSFLKRDRDDAPEYVKIMTKPLNENNRRFYDFINIPKVLLGKLGQVFKNAVEVRVSNYENFINK